MNNQKKIIIAIDGPAGSGKSTTAKLLAKKLNYNYIDSGAMYRAVTYFAIQNNFGSDKIDDLSEMTKALDFKFINNGEGLIVNNLDLTNEIRLPSIAEKVSIYSKIGEIREILVKKQRELGKDGGVVMEGRDITTVVFPDADLKIYLTAGISTRTERRFKELLEKGISSDKEKVKENLETRDLIDSSRKVSPLSFADGAIMIDTSSMTIENQVNIIYQYAIEIINKTK